MWVENMLEEVDKQGKPKHKLKDLLREYNASDKLESSIALAESMGLAKVKKVR